MVTLLVICTLYPLYSHSPHHLALVFFSLPISAAYVQDFIEGFSPSEPPKFTLLAHQFSFSVIIRFCILYLTLLSHQLFSTLHGKYCVRCPHGY